MLDDASPADSGSEPSGIVEQSQVHLGDGQWLSCYHLRGAGPGLLVSGGFGALGITDKPLGMAALYNGLQRGLRTILIEYRGQGASSGERWSQTVPRMRDDILAVADHFGLQNCIGVGASLGAWAMLAAQQQRAGLLQGMLALAPAFDWDKTYIAPRLASGRLVRLESGKLHQPGTTMEVDQALLETAEEARLAPDAIRLPRGLVAILGAADAVANPAYAVSILDQFRQNNRVEVRQLDGEGHNVSTLEGPKLQVAFHQALDTLLQWQP